jgi:hypothetical protein
MKILKIALEMTAILRLCSGVQDKEITTPHRAPITLQLVNVPRNLF